MFVLISTSKQHSVTTIDGVSETVDTLKGIAGVNTEWIDTEDGATTETSACYYSIYEVTQY
jgi:hypothetical protein